MSTNRKQPRNEHPLGFTDRIGQKGKLTIIGLSTAALAACGVGGGDKDAPRPTVTVTAEQSPSPSTSPDITTNPVIETPATSPATTSSETTPPTTETENPSEVKLYVENPDGTVSFPAENYYNPEKGIDKREQLVKDFVEQALTNAINNGATIENVEAAFKAQGGATRVQDYLSTIAESNSEAFANSAFQDWKSSDPAKAVEKLIIGDIEELNSTALYAFAISVGKSQSPYGDGVEREFYRAEVEVGDLSDVTKGPESNPYIGADVHIIVTDNTPESYLYEQEEPGYGGSNYTPVVRDMNASSTPHLAFNIVVDNNGNRVWQITDWGDFDRIYK
ncbi:MAG: hypothetical protein WBP12_04255 [Candidatus Saccharimonas sp.]